MLIEKIQDIECPPKDSQSFENYLVAVESNCDGEFNLKFEKGDRSNLKSEKKLKEIKIYPERAEVKRAVVWYTHILGLLTCIELYDKFGRKLLEAGDPMYDR